MPTQRIADPALRQAIPAVGLVTAWTVMVHLGLCVGVGWRSAPAFALHAVLVSAAYAVGLVWVLRLRVRDLSDRGMAAVVLPQLLTLLVSVVGAIGSQLTSPDPTSQGVLIGATVSAPLFLGASGIWLLGAAAAWWTVRRRRDDLPTPLPEPEDELLDLAQPPRG